MARTDSEPSVTVLPREELEAAKAAARLRQQLSGSGMPELELIAFWTDNALQIPGTNIRFGLDSILGLIPGLGDTLMSAASIYILHAAHRHGVPKWMMAKMATNVALDYVVGSVPIVGDAFDVYWKANKKNVELLRRHMDANPIAKKPQAADWWFFGILVGALVGVLALSITLAYFVILGISRLFTG